MDDKSMLSPVSPPLKFLKKRKISRRVNYGRMIKMCPGGRHAWYESDLGYPVRKEIL